MAERTEAASAAEARPSPGSRAAGVVRGIGAGTADLTEELGRAGVAALAGTVRSVTRVWGDLLGMTIDGLVTPATSRRRRRARPDASHGGGTAPRRCIDLIDLRTGDQIDEALTEGLAAAAPSRRTRAME